MRRGFECRLFMLAPAGGMQGSGEGEREREMEDGIHSQQYAVCAGGRTDESGTSAYCCLMSQELSLGVIVFLGSN